MANPQTCPADCQPITWLMPPDAANLRTLCNLFRIEVSSTDDNQVAALNILINLYAMPAHLEHDDRHRHGVQILQSAHAAFPPESGPKAARFFGRIQMLVIEMQEFPSWFSAFTLSNEELVSRYVFLWYLTAVLGGLGFGGLGGLAAGSGILGNAGTAIKEAIKIRPEGIKEGMTDKEVAEILKKTRSKRAGAFSKTFLGRSAGRGPIFEALQGRLAVLGPMFLGLAVTCSVLYAALIDEMKTIKFILLDKFQKGQLSEGLFKKAFTEIPPDSVKQYWEIKHW